MRGAQANPAKPTLRAEASIAFWAADLIDFSGSSCSLCVGFDICRGICHKLTMSERYVKLFKNGRNQAVRIPREFELPGENAIIRKEGQRLIIEAVPPKSLLAVLATLPTLDEDFPPIEDLPAEPVDL